MGVLVQSTVRRRQELAAVSAPTGNARRRNRRLVRRACCAVAQSDGVASWSVGGLWASSGIDDGIDQMGAAG